MFVCSKPRARLTHKNYDRLLTHTHARTQLEDGFFLFFVFLLLHPLTAAAAGHHPGSSSFASQPEHSGRGRPPRIVHGQRSPGIFCSSLSLSTPWKKQVVPLENSHATDPNLLFFLLSAVVVLFLLRSHTHTQCSHPQKIAIFRIPAVPRRFTPSRRHSRIAPGVWP